MGNQEINFDYEFLLRSAHRSTKGPEGPHVNSPLGDPGRDTLNRRPLARRGLRTGSTEVSRRGTSKTVGQHRSKDTGTFRLLDRLTEREVQSRNPGVKEWRVYPQYLVAKQNSDPFTPHPYYSPESSPSATLPIVGPTPDGRRENWTSVNDR